MNTVEDKEKLSKFIDQCTWTWKIYKYYEELFDSGEETLKLLENCSHQFFYDLNILLSEYIMLKMCTLTDSATGKARGETVDNLTVNHLFKKISWPSEIQSHLKDKIDRLNEIVKPLREARNKTIAHADLKTFINNTLLGAMPKEGYEEFFEILEDGVNIMHENLVGGPYSIKVANAFEPAHQLLKKLKNIKD